MRNNFTKDYLNISIRRSNANDDISMTISSETGLCHKSQLYVNEKRLAEQLERFWKSIKTKKLSAMSIDYGQVDYYDNMKYRGKKVWKVFDKRETAMYTEMEKQQLGLGRAVENVSLVANRKKLLAFVRGGS